MPNQKKTRYSNSCVTPIYQNTSFYYENTSQVIQYHTDQAELGRYGRYDNPNWLEVEGKIAALHRCQESLIFSSGMNAIVTTLLTFLKPGDQLIHTGKCYRNVSRFFDEMLTKWGVETISIDPANQHEFNKMFTHCYNEKVRIIFLEMPSNPHLYLVELEHVQKIIGSETLLIVDNTLAVPFRFPPAEYGIDLLIQSCSKYMGGHGDLMAGSVSGPSDLIGNIREYRNVFGGVVDAHGAFLLNRSLETYSIRMDHFCRSGLALARFLEKHPNVSRVYYTGLSSHPHYDLAQRYLSGHGGVVTFEVDADRETVTRFVDSLEHPFMGSNFGTSHTMVEQCSIFTYYKLSSEQRALLGISDRLVRLSLGYEDVSLIIEDLDRSFKRMGATA